MTKPLQTLGWTASLALAILAIDAGSAQAAQDATVRSRSAQIHQDANPGSSVLAILPQGQRVRISDTTKNGWYHVVLPRPVGNVKLGWILDRDIVTGSQSNELKSSGISVRQTRRRRAALNTWALSADYEAHFISAASLHEAALLSSQSTMSPNINLALGYRLSSLWEVDAILGLTSYTDRTISAKGTVLGVLAEYSFLRRNTWKLGFAFGGGASMGTTVTIADTPSTGFVMPMLEGKLTGRKYFGNSFAIEAVAGYRKLSGDLATATGPSVTVDLSAPFIGAGLRLEF
jgi:hypothetical protein